VTLLGSPTIDDPTASRFDYARAQATVQRMIARYGRPASLRSNKTGALRKCRVVLTGWRVQDIFGKAYDPLVRRALFGALDLPAGPPDHERESLLVYKFPWTDPPVVEETLKLMEPAVPVNMSGVPVYWFLPVRA
jgi:hypothetical protein